MRVLIVSNAPWTKTGYGLQGASLARRLQADGHTVAYMCNYGLEGGGVDWNGITCLPTGPEGGYADPIVHGHIRAFLPDLVFTIFDVWVLKNKPFPMPEAQQHIGPRWAGWVPIDHDPMSLGNRDVIQRMTYPVAMSQHGFDSMTAEGITASYIPHGVEKDVYYTAEGRQEFRRLIELPKGSFLFGSVGLNRYFPNRKGFDRLMQAFARMPENAYLYLHTLPNSQNGSLDLNQIAERLGIEKRVIFPDPYNYVMGYSQEGMNAIYSAIDCYVQPTMGEGFGLPVLESQACGCPVIATNCTSMPELVSPNSSELVSATPFFVPDLANRYLIDIDELEVKMRDIMRIFYEDHDGYVSMRANAGKWANNWDWDTLWDEQWRPFLADIARDVERAPRAEYHRGMGLVTINDDYVRKQDSNIRSPAVRKELVFLENVQGIKGIIPVLRKGIDEKDGTTWFDMPKMTPLRELDLKALSEAQKQRILTSVSDALSALHDRGLAHRDVCPENVVVAEDGDAYLIDFEWAAHCAGDSCVDFVPWDNMQHTVPLVQTGAGQRGYHTIVSYVRELPLEEKSHGMKGVPYQAIDGVGERDCETRWQMMKPDVKGKRVLDVGCNLGWFVRRSLEEGAEYAVGLDNDAAVLDAARILGDGSYFTQDLDTYKAGMISVGATGDGRGVTSRFDVAFCLSVLQHLKDPDRLLRELPDSADTLYIEQPPRFITNYIASVLAESEYMGESERGRPIYHVKAKVTA